MFLRESVLDGAFDSCALLRSRILTNQGAPVEDQVAQRLLSDLRTSSDGSLISIYDDK